jgi:hypothetical protein
MRSWKSHRLTSHTWLGLNPQIERPLSRIVGAIGFYNSNSGLVSFESVFPEVRKIQKFSTEKTIPYPGLELRTSGLAVGSLK